MLPVESRVVELIGLVALAVVFARLGVRVLRMTDAEWDGVPSLATGRQTVAA